MRGRIVLIAATALGWLANPPRADRVAVEKAVREIVAKHGEGIRAGLWVGGTSGEARYESDSGATLPTASAIKTAILIELFARFARALDETPEGLGAILKDDHPAIAHFTPAQRDEIRKGLSGASVRRIGGVMMGSAAASNIVYNAAANVSIALLGGPEGTTKAIHARDPGFAPIVVRRYMLTNRKARGDNEATTEALAAVLRRLASRRVPGLGPSTIDEIRLTVLVKDDPKRGRHFYKDGDLASAQITIVRSGWYEPPDGPATVYVVMLAQPDAGARTADEAHRRLAETASRLVEALVVDEGVAR